MNRITKFAFADLYEMASGISSTKEQAGHGAPFVSFGTVYNNYFLPDELPDLMDTSEKEQETYSIHKDDVLITRTSETIDELAMSCVAIKDYPGATYSGFTKRLRPKKEGVVYSKYLAFYLRGYLFRKAVTNNAFMTLRASFNEDIFSFLELYLPEYHQQKAIGDLLYKVEEKIQINKKINNNLEQQVTAIFHYWFTQFNFPSYEQKTYRLSGGKMVWNDSIKGLIPANWKTGNLYDIAEFINGLACQNNRPKQGERYLPVIKIREMHEGITKNTEIVSATIPPKNIVNTGDILFSWSATLETIFWYGGEAGLNQHIFKVVPVVSSHKNYVYQQLAAYIFKFVKMAEARKTTMGHITSDHLKQSIIPIPPDSVVDNYCTSTEALYLMMEKCSVENRKLIKLRDWLLPMLMNGQATIED